MKLLEVGLHGAAVQPDCLGLQVHHSLQQLPPQGEVQQANAYGSSATPTELLRVPVLLLKLLRRVAACTRVATGYAPRDRSTTGVKHLV